MTVSSAPVYTTSAVLDASTSSVWIPAPSVFHVSVSLQAVSMRWSDNVTPEPAGLSLTTVRLADVTVDPAGIWFGPVPMMPSKRIRPCSIGDESVSIESRLLLS